MQIRQMPQIRQRAASIVTWTTSSLRCTLFNAARWALCTELFVQSAVHVILVVTFKTIWQIFSVKARGFCQEYCLQRGEGTPNCTTFLDQKRDNFGPKTKLLARSFSLFVALSSPSSVWSTLNALWYFFRSQSGTVFVKGGGYPTL